MARKDFVMKFMRGGSMDRAGLSILRIVGNSQGASIRESEEVFHRQGTKNAKF